MSDAQSVDLPLVDLMIGISAELSLADPDTCKFTVSRSLHPGGPFFFGNKERAAGSPLGERLFALPGVANVLIAECVVTIGKEPSASWSGLKSAIGTAILTACWTTYTSWRRWPSYGLLATARSQASANSRTRYFSRRSGGARISARSPVWQTQ